MPASDQLLLLTAQIEAQSGIPTKTIRYCEERGTWAAEAVGTVSGTTLLLAGFPGASGWAYLPILQQA